MAVPEDGRRQIPAGFFYGHTLQLPMAAKLCFLTKFTHVKMQMQLSVHGSTEAGAGRDSKSATRVEAAKKEICGRPW